MEPINFPMTGYRINEYLLVLSPPEDIWQKVNRVKEEFATKFNAPMARMLKPHIALVNFVTLDMMEERFVQRLQSISMGLTPFKVELKDYGSFPSHTIYVNVATKLPVQNVVRQLKEAQRLLRLNNESKPHFIESPHIGIARKLKPWQFEQGWMEFSHRQFTGRFIADSMLLLKRRAGEKTAFQIAKRFDFQNLPVATRQGNLFNGALFHS
jgi:2'-5' RNA ligase